MRIRYDKLRRFVENAEGYSLREEGGEVELVFATPSLGEAAGIGEGGEGRLIVIKGVREGDYVVFKKAYVKGGEAEAPIDLRELELWIGYIEDLY